MSGAKMDVSIPAPHCTTAHDNTDNEREGKRKRKRDDGTVEIEVDRRVFTIKQSPSDPFGRPLSLTPLRLLPRAELPLAYLDVSHSAVNRFFSAQIPVLESSHRHGSDASVLVAREAGGRLYAVERVCWRQYAICRLAEWVREENLQGHVKYVDQGMHLAGKRRRTAVKSESEMTGDGKRQWWSSAVVDLPVSSDVSVPSDSPAAVLPVLDMRTPHQRGSGGEAAMADSGREKLRGDQIPALNEQADSMPAPVIQPTQNGLQELAKHYLEALYVSRTSLAYFTKGPISRARAAATTEVSISIPELIAFLRQCILTSSVMDKKYRDGLVGIFKDLPIRPAADSSPVIPKKKKTRKWKPKRDKAGFFIDEQEFVERWWTEADHDESNGSESADVSLRKRVAKLRNRETFLQIILCLEVLALEVSLSAEDKKRHEAFTAGLESQGLDDTQQEDTQATAIGETKPSRPKKKQDLTALLETLLDKLTIWYSLESHSPLKARTGADGHDNEQHTENDELRSFCIDVIIPFYVSRIPQQANVVNKKLGGPSAPSPVKRKAMSKPTKDSARKPGEPAVRPPPPEKKPRHALSRTSTETDKLLPKPNLHRSSTDSAILLPPIKREPSDPHPQLASIPAAKANRNARASLMSTLTRREVDLTALSAASEAKRKKKADVDAKLREAIGTLRKPNRAAAVKEVAETADASFAMALARGRAGAGRAKGAAVGAAGGAVVRDDGKERGESQGGYVVAATPSKHGGRVAKSVCATPYHGSEAHGVNAAALSSGSSALMVPSSSARLKAIPPSFQSEGEALTSTPAVPATGHRPRVQTSKAFPAGVEETPSRGFARFMPPGLAREPGKGVAESPLAARRATVAAVEQTPSAPREAIAFALTPVASTPLRQPAALPLVEASLNCRSPAGRKEGCGVEGREKTIYEALGWDDEYEQLG